MPTSMTASRAFGREWQDQNAHRWHPFASEPVSDSGVPLPSDVFIDAMVVEYIVQDAEEGVRITSVDFQARTVSAVAGGSELTGGIVPGDGEVRLFNGSVDCGALCVGPGFEREVSSGIRYSFEDVGGVRLSASCVCPVETGGVLSIVFPDLGFSTGGSVVEISGDGILVPSLYQRDDGEWELSFDAVNTGEGYDVSGSSVNRKVNRLKILGLTSLGKTPIHVQPVSMQHDDGEMGSNPAEIDVYTGDLTVDDICYRAHLDPDMSDIYDVCDYEGGCEPGQRKYNNVGWGIKGCSVWLNTPSDYLGHRNAVLISGTKGGQVPSSPRLDGLSGKEAADEVRKILSAPLESGNGIVISIPGSSHV